MGQSESTKNIENKPEIPLPKRGFSTEFFVGLFTLGALLCCGYLAVGLGGLELNKSSHYNLTAEFDNISGLKFGASVEISGVPIGEVENISLNEGQNSAVVKLKIKQEIKLRDDDIAAIRTKGIIGDRYVKISPGGSDVFLQPGGKLTETESVVDIEDIIGKIVHSLTKEKDSDE
jgi:phospholipid/cholesterol/gamma-HCH transport system substrate-binding protein